MDDGGSDEGLPLVLLDTNALLMPFQLGLDLEGEIARAVGRCRVVVPEVVLAELQAMEARLRDGRAALRFAERFEVLASEGVGDDAIMDLARRTGGIVVTGDRELIARLRAEGLRVLRPRQRKRLELR
jgi:rRNA-processing protein FCF1